jgi:P-type Cu+ transporter
LEKINWKVEGMTCSNCALTIGSFLKKEGLSEVKVNLISGDLSFQKDEKTQTEKLIKGIESLGYHVLEGGEKETERPRPFLSSYRDNFIFCAFFTVLLALPMISGPFHAHWTMNPWIQLALCLPVYSNGLRVFGKSAWHSLRNRLPNMNVLIVAGSSAAFFYSLIGTLLVLGENYQFYETASTIISFIFLGNYIEEISLRSTQKELNLLVKNQRVMASMVTYDQAGEEHIFPVENTQLRSGDLILIRSGEQVPADCKIIWGNASVDEKIVTGEGMPVAKMEKDLLIGGSLLLEGTIRAQVSTAPEDSVLSRIIDMVKQAQGEKPPVQRLADRISGIFVPVVLGISVLCFLLNFFYLHELAPAIMRSVAVLVIACPCAMGLATPAAIATGLGRAAKNGILFRHAGSLERFREIRQVVFDKTGTLTDGQFQISDYKAFQSEEDFKLISRSIFKYSNHPIARSLMNSFKGSNEIRWKNIEEIKGFGMKGVDRENNHYMAGSWLIAPELTKEDTNHSVYIIRNDQLMGWIDLSDKLRVEAAQVVNYFKRKKIRTIILSGDKEKNCTELKERLGIDEVYSEQKPEQKLQVLESLIREAPAAMIGDGINDAPALAKATVGISMSEASQLAVQTADVVLLGKGIWQLPFAMELGKATFLTIRQNLFWAFFYNILAIPIAATGLLSPSIAALAMAFSDLVLVINSIRLYYKKIIKQ